MSSETTTQAAERAATELHLSELIAIQPRNLKGGLEPGQRMPGGARPGKGRAQSLDFDGISPYAPGDDVRAIEWKSSLRTGTIQMRRFAAESHRARMIVLDLRADLYFGASDRLMAKSAGLIAAWLGWESLALQEPVGLIIPGGAEIAPRRGRRHLLGLLDTIASAYQSSGADIPAADTLEAASLSLTHGDEICLISDLPLDATALSVHARRLSRLRRMRLYLVEDRAISAGPPPGRYPSRGPDGVRRTPMVGKDGAVDGASRRELIDAGWEVISAMDILPRGVGAS